jgi:putative addiction module component (TIGR02574 family)
MLRRRGHAKTLYFVLMARVRDVLDRGLRLPLKQRASLAQELIASLNEDRRDDPGVVAEVWDEEIARRVDDVRLGRVKAVAWWAVKKEMNRAIQSVRGRHLARSR